MELALTFRTISATPPMVEALRSSNKFALLVQSEIGGRLVATFKIAAPIEIKVAGSDKTDVVEIASPKDGSPYDVGLEHVEFVIGEGTLEPPLNDEVHTTLLKS